MAISWSNFSNGVGLATLRNSLNTVLSAIKNNIDTIETSLGSDVVLIADTGILCMADGSVPSASLTTSYQKVKMVASTHVNVANGHMSADHTNALYTINTTGVYKLIFSGSMTAGNGDIVEFNWNVNGTSAMSNPPQFTGQGATRVSIDQYQAIQLAAGDVLYIEAKSSSPTTMTPINCHFVIEKTHY